MSLQSNRVVRFADSIIREGTAKVITTTEPPRLIVLPYDLRSDAPRLLRASIRWPVSTEIVREIERLRALHIRAHGDSRSGWEKTLRKETKRRWEENRKR